MTTTCEMAEEALIAKQARIDELERFVDAMLNPEEFGFSVTAEVRDRARQLKGLPMVDTHLWAGKFNPTGEE